MAAKAGTARQGDQKWAGVVANFFVNRLRHVLKYHKITTKQFLKRVSQEDVVFVISLISKRVLTHHEGELVLREKYGKPDKDVSDIVAELILRRD